MTKCSFISDNHCISWHYSCVIRTYRFDVLVAPACRVGDESDNEEHPGEGLNGAADGEDGAADATAAADGQQGEQVGDDLQQQGTG